MVLFPTHAGVVKLVDTRGLGPRVARRAGSIPVPGTKIHIAYVFFIHKKTPSNR